MDWNSRTDRSLSRRRLLVGSGGAGLSLTAGCLATLPTTRRRVRYGEVSLPAAESPAYQQWIPDEFDAADPPGNLNLRFQQPRGSGEQAMGAPFGDRRTKQRMNHVGIDFEDFECVLEVGQTTVGSGPFDRTTVKETLETVGYEHDATEDKFDYYRRQFTPAQTEAVAVGDEAVLFAPTRGAITEIADTAAGERPRRAETTEAFARLTEELESLPVVTLGHGHRAETERTVLAGGTGCSFDETYAYTVHTRVYRDEADVSRRDYERRLEDEPAALDANRVDIRTDGRVLTGIIQFDHETFEQQHGPLFSYPLVTWDLEYDGGDTLTIIHQSGDTVATDLFTIIDTRRDSNPDQQLTDLGETISAGESLSVTIADPDNWSLRLDGTVPGTETTWTEFNVGDDWFDR